VVPTFYHGNNSSNSSNSNIIISNKTSTTYSLCHNKNIASLSGNALITHNAA